MNFYLATIHPEIQNGKMDFFKVLSDLGPEYEEFIKQRRLDDLSEYQIDFLLSKGLRLEMKVGVDNLFHMNQTNNRIILRFNLMTTYFDKKTESIKVSTVSHYRSLRHGIAS